MQSVSESVTLFVGSLCIQKVRIIRLEPGSIRVHMVLDPDICGGGEAPADVANLLAQQAADPQSPLKQVTMHTNILFLCFGLSVLSASEITAKQMGIYR